MSLNKIFMPFNVNKFYLGKNAIILAHLLAFITLSALSIGGTFSAITNYISIAINEEIETFFSASTNEAEASPCYYKKAAILSRSGIFEKLSQVVNGAEPEQESIPVSSNDRLAASPAMHVPGDAFLACYHYERYGANINSKDIPPTGIILDYFQIGETWRSPDFQVKDYNNAVIEDLDQKEEVFKGTFRVIDAKLNALVLLDEGDLNRLKISNDIIPGGFRLENFQTKEFELPREAIDWIKRQQVKQQQLAIADTVILLMVLGSLGSIIFLLRQHIDDPGKLPIRAYVYKPIFGMLLALSSFIVGVGVDSLLTESASVEEIKVEGLLILAFGSGLLSEQVYAFLENQVYNRTGKKLEDPTEKKPIDIPTVKTLEITNDALSVHLSDGRTISVPLALYPRLLNASTEERQNWRLIGKGEEIHWNQLDEDISVKNIVLGQFPGES